MVKQVCMVIAFIICFVQTKAQNPSCPSPYVYLDGAQFIRVFDPSQPISTNNPSLTNIPTFGSGLALMPNINGGTLTPTFYSTSGGTYWYWNGVSWTNTGHSTGNNAAVNLAGCGGALYNLVGGTGQVYVYNGSGNGTLLTTIQGFNGGGPYDLVTDCNCNFYALNTTTPNQNLTLYSPTGQPQCTYTMSGMPNATAGGGFAIVGNYIYVKNNLSSPASFYVGEITASGITFTAVPAFTAGAGDFASCPVCYPATSFSNGAVATAGMLGCTTPTVSVAAYSPVSPVTYSWSGPAIVGPATTSNITVSQAGVYTCTMFAGGCPPSQGTVSATVLNSSVTVPASITPNGNICLPAGGAIPLSVVHTYSNDLISWNGPGIITAPLSESIMINSAGVYSVLVIDPFTGCTGVDIVTVTSTPTVALSVSDFSICSHNTSGSPATVTITPTGASNYTFYPGTGMVTSSPNGPLIPVSYLNPSGSLLSPISGTLVGKTAGCTDTAVATVTVVANPTLTTAQQLYTICPGGNKVIAVSGANSYTWTGSPGLNSYSGGTVVSAPLANSTYTVAGSSDGCFSQLTSVNVNVLPIPNISISPATSTICHGSQVLLVANTNANSFTWSPSSGLSTISGPVVTATPQASTVYSLTVELNTCRNSATASITVVQPPVVSLVVGTTSMCALASNASPVTCTMLASGAGSYNVSMPPGIGAFPPNGPFFTIMPVAPYAPSVNILTATVTGVSGVCSVVKTQTFAVVPNPSIQITPLSSNICPGQIQSFTATGANNYYWSSLAGYTLNAPNVISASPLVTSFYAVHGSSDGCESETKSAILIVNPIPQVNAASLSNTVCAGNSTTLTATGNAGFYTWQPAISLSPSNGTFVTASPLSTQIYTVLATLNGCTNQAVTSVSVINIPVISAAATQYTVCRGYSTNLSATGAQAYQWFPFNSLNQPGGNIVIATPGGNTTYTVRGYNGVCTGSTTVSVTILEPPDLNLSADGPFICAGGFTKIYSHGAHKYFWSPPGTVQLLPGDSVAIVSPSVSTVYNVTGYNYLGTVSCNETQSYSVVVVPFARASIDPVPAMCPGQKIQLVAKGGDTYSWRPETGLSSAALPVVVASPAVSMIYTVHVSNSGVCGSEATVAVNLGTLPEVKAGRDTIYHLNDEMWITAEGSGKLSWIEGESINCKDCPQTRVYATRNGCYVIQAVSDDGCAAYDDMCVQVEDEFSIYIPNSFTPNKDGINDVFLVYGESISQITMTIYDRWGERIFSSSDYKNGWDGSLNGQQCKEDTYTYQVTYYGLNRKFYSKTGHVTLVR